MRKVLIFAGTTEGRELSERLSEMKIHHTLCVATSYGELVLHDSPYLTVHKGRMDEAQIRQLIQEDNYLAVVDATHPYAKVVTEEIKSGMKGMTVPYFRLIRERDEALEDEHIVYFDSIESCVEVLQESRGNIFLTTGSKDLWKFCIHDELKDRLFVRVLPSEESIGLCTKEGITGRHVIAMQGPFSTEINEALIWQYDISYVVTKASGAKGGYQQKIDAVKRTGKTAYVIGRPREDFGYHFDQICDKLEELCMRDQVTDSKMQIFLAGIGMGDGNTFTKEVKDAMQNADILIGSSRLIKDSHPKLEKKDCYRAQDIILYLQQVREKYPQRKLKVTILFSGDSGFYSGCGHVVRELQNEIRQERLCADIRVLPGISSVSYLAARLGESYHDAAIYSMHGKSIHHLVRNIRTHQKTFLLVSDAHDVAALGQNLLDAGLSHMEITIGFNLSYEDEEIYRLSPGECLNVDRKGLYLCYILNPEAVPRRLTHGVPDDTFIRGRVPMTKEEVREVSICKLRLCEHGVVYDIGSGTGSIATEIAALSDTIRVFAIERKEEALSVMKQNMKKFELDNVTLIQGEAPDGLKELPPATHAFIGGSGGRLGQILKELYEINPEMHIVINAITLETIQEVYQALETFPVVNEDIIQMQVSRGNKVGNYHMMKAENPIWICSFTFQDGEIQ